MTAFIFHSYVRNGVGSTNAIRTSLTQPLLFQTSSRREQRTEKDVANERRTVETRGGPKQEQRGGGSEIANGSWRERDCGSYRKKLPAHDGQRAFKMASPIMKASIWSFAKENRSPNYFLCDRRPVWHVQSRTTTISHFMDCAERRSRPFWPSLRSKVRQCVGVICIESSKPNSWKETDQELITRVAAPYIASIRLAIAAWVFAANRLMLTENRLFVPEDRS